jgi:hypothetical protein
MGEEADFIGVGDGGGWPAADRFQSNQSAPKQGTGRSYRHAENAFGKFMCAAPGLGRSIDGLFNNAAPVPLLNGESGTPPSGRPDGVAGSVQPGSRNRI